VSSIVKLFEPGNIGRLSIKNRIVMAPMGIEGMVEPDGRISERAIDYYVERARGGTGLIITGLTKVEHVIERYLINSWSILPRVDTRIVMPRLNELVDAVHDYGAKISIQLTAGFGRVLSADMMRIVQPVAPSELPCYWNPKVTTRELTTEEVEKLAKAFGNAAGMVADAGVDAIELHAHEGYLFDQFQTSLWNRRTDKYGGDLDGRLRFALEVIECIKNSAGKGFPVIYRYGIKHYMEGGRDVKESLEMAECLEKTGVDAIHADAGCHENWYWPHPTTYQSHGCMVDMAEAVKKVVKIPVVAVGRLGVPELAERVLREKKADFIALGRALLADPEWPVKVKEGRLDEIRPCIGDHDGCFRRILESKRLSCTVNPAVGNEREFRITPAEKPRSVLIVGGGVAGLEAARVAALRGHKVTLYEKSSELGGHLIPGSVPEFKQDLKRLRDYLVTQIRKLGVKVELGKEVTPGLIEKMKPKVVIVATGSTPIIPDIPGVEKDKVVTAVDLLLGKKDVGEDVIVVGGGLVGCETAAYLAKKGKRVTTLEMLEDIAVDLFHANREHLLRMLNEGHVNVLTRTNLMEITDEGVIVMDKQWKKKMIKADTVVLALGLRSERKLLIDLEGKVPELHALGDCVEPRKILHAIWEAFRIVRQI